MQLSCAVCGKSFEAVKAQARYCGPTCNKRAQRAGIASRRRGASVVSISPPRIEDANGLVDAVRQTIEAAGQLGSVEGQLAIVLAEKMVGPETAGGMAAVSKELSRVMALVLGAHGDVADPLDELKRRRDAKRSR